MKDDRYEAKDDVVVGVGLFANKQTPMTVEIGERNFAPCGIVSSIVSRDMDIS